MIRKALLCVLMAIVVVCCQAASFDPLAASIEDNIRHPQVPGRASQLVSSAMQQLQRALRQAGYTVTAVRNGEVVMVTIPSAKLFAPNETSLRDGAEEKLRPLMQYIKRPDNYKVIVAVHSDITGDEIYNDRLTTDRANAIDDYFFNLNDNNDTGIIPYGLGYDEPVAPNNTVVDRARNRRVEIYFVPTSDYIDRIRHSR